MIFIAWMHVKGSELCELMGNGYLASQLRHSHTMEGWIQFQVLAPYASYLLIQTLGEAVMAQVIGFLPPT